MKRASLALLRAFGLVLVMALFSCQKQEDETIPVLKVPQKMFLAEGGKVNIEVVATNTWTLSAGEQGWIHFSRNSGESGSFVVEMTVDPNTGEATRHAAVTVSGPTLSKSVEVSQTGTGVAADVPMWLELPTMTPNSNYFFGTHDMSGGAYVSNQVSGTRNYSFYWSKNGLVSKWVAYPLNKGLCGTGNYNYDWSGAFDTMLPSEWYQPDITQYSYGGLDFSNTSGKNWNRGHLMARADRQTSQAAVTSTCRTTNIAPQDGTFNSGIWGDLEMKVRNSWAKASTTDTLYVVVGCVQDGSTKYTSSSYGKTPVQVPAAFYKALLMRKKGGDYSMCAFYIPHTQSAYDTGVFTGDYADYKISVSDLEGKTGISYFDNLANMPGMDKDKVSAMKKTIANW